VGALAALPLKLSPNFFVKSPPIKLLPSERRIISPEKKIDWSKWHPLLWDNDIRIVEFCTPCEYLKPNDEREPRCRYPKFNRMSHLVAVFQYENCPYAVVDGVLGTIEKGVFKPKEG
jgi:hypothetical protein